MTKTAMSRQELFDLVWSEPVKKLADKAGISDVAFAQTCRKHDVPLPPRGYWAKLQAGKKVPKDRLPPRGHAGVRAGWQRSLVLLIATEELGRDRASSATEI